MNAYRGMEVKLHSFLPSALDGGEWDISRYGRLSSGKKTGTTKPFWMFCRREISLAFCGIRNPDNAVLSLVTNIYYKQGHRSKYSTPNFQNIQLSSVIHSFIIIQP